MEMSRSNLGEDVKGCTIHGAGSKRNVERIYYQTVYSAQLRCTMPLDHQINVYSPMHDSVYSRWRQNPLSPAPKKSSTHFLVWELFGIPDQRQYCSHARSHSMDSPDNDDGMRVWNVGEPSKVFLYIQLVHPFRHTNLSIC